MSNITNQDTFAGSGIGGQTDAGTTTVMLAVSILLAVTLLVALTGPFGTYENEGFINRLIYWGVVNTVSLAIALAAKRAVNAFAGNASWLQREAVVILLTTLIFTPFLAFWSHAWFVTAGDKIPGTPILGMYVFAICVGVSSIIHGVPWLLRDRVIAEMKAEPERGRYRAALGPRLLERLPDGADHDVLRLSVNGHKVSVITAENTYELRMRFADAVAEMDGADGFITHRSHWVARGSIVAVEQDGSRTFVVLTNGDRVPVSRKYRAALETADIG